MGACMSKKALIAEAVMPSGKRDSVPVQQKELANTTSPIDTSNTTATSDNTTAPPVDTAATSAVAISAAQTVTNTPATTTKSLDENNTTTTATTTPKSEEEGERDDHQEGKNQYQDALNDKLMQMGDQLADHNAKLEDTLLAPVNGVSLERYATIQAHIAKNSSLYDTILEKNGLTRTEWEAVDQGWQANMRKDAAKGGVATLYGKYYMAAGAGEYGNSGKQAAEVMNIAGVSTGEAPSPGGETDQVSFDRYIEWMGAQGAWSSLGMDVNEMLKKVFNITAHDYANVSGYWGMKMMSDMNLAMKMGTDLQKWTSAYMTKPYGPDSK